MGGGGVLEVFICDWSGHVDTRKGVNLNSTAEIRC